MRTRTYRGWRIAGEVIVAVEITGSEGQLLEAHRLLPEASLKIRNHSPEGFNWGYRGSGPAQLALAILLDALGSPRMAEKIYQQFKNLVVSRWRDEWSIDSKAILDWIASNGALLSRGAEGEEGDATDRVSLSPAAAEGGVP
jgi:hypothetical protein